MPSGQETPVPTLETGKGAFVFFSYAHQDKWLRDELEKHLSNLKYRGLITTWHDQEIRAGEDWAHQIDISLNKAQIILLLISSDFMASEYSYGREMKRALERQEQQEANVIPVLLRPVLFTDAPFAKLQMLPTNGKPIIQWQNQDSAFVDIAYGIERVAKKYLLQPPVVQSDRASSSQKGALQPSDVSSSHVISTLLNSLSSPFLESVEKISGMKRLPIGIFVVGLIITGIVALLLHSHLLFLATIVGFSLLVASVAALKVIGSLRAGRNRREPPTSFSKQPSMAHTVSPMPVVIRREDPSSRSEFDQILETFEAYHRQGVDRRQTYYEEAIRAYHLALLRNPSDGNAFQGMGNALYALGRYKEALNAFQQATKYHPTSNTYAGLANVFAKLQQDSEAVVSYEKAIELNPTMTFNYDDLIQSLLALGRREDAEHVRTKAKQFGYHQDDDLLESPVNNLLPPLPFNLYQMPQPRTSHLFYVVQSGEVACVISQDETRFALSDENPASNLARPWATLLGRKWIEKPLGKANIHTLPDWLDEPRSQWERWVKEIWRPVVNEQRVLTEDDPLKQEDVDQILKRGASATLLGVEVNRQSHQWHALAVGDSCLFLVRRSSSWQILMSLPLEKSTDFIARPPLLSSHRNTNLATLLPSITCDEGTYQAGDILLMATDALAYWLLSQKEQGLSEWQHLLAMSDQQSFVRFIEKQRRDGMMEKDDTTLVVIPL